LRRPPGRDALATLAEAVRPGSRVGTIRRLRGGVSSGMHAVQLIGPGDERQWVVVRRYGAWRLQHDPRVAEREWAILTALDRVAVPAPRPIWLDPSGAVFGCPTLVTSRMPGRGDLAPRNLDSWIRQLAETIARVHAAPLRSEEVAVLVNLRDEIDGLLAKDDPPEALAGRPLGAEVWHAMKAAWPGMQHDDAVIVHGDYWPGNTLWRRGRLTAIIDWEQARYGDPAKDVACCRLDLTLLVGTEAADAFLRAYRAASGHPIRRRFFWELFMASWAIESLDEWVKGYHDLGRTDLTVVEARARLERFVARALDEAAADRADALAGG
jgi:aminoglycoside phosphotransferase (APT) family kinase protein